MTTIPKMRKEGNSNVAKSETMGAAAVEVVVEDGVTNNGEQWEEEEGEDGDVVVVVVGDLIETNTITKKALMKLEQNQVSLIKDIIQF